MKTFEFHTLGCKVNQYETEAMEELLERHGYRPRKEGETSDLLVINTCTVTHVSDAKSRQQIRKMKRENPSAIVAVVGCYAQVAPQEIEAIEGVDIILGTKGRARLPELIRQVEETGLRQVDVGNLDEQTEFDALSISTEESMTRATIKIQEGCDMFCSYCIIPYARGHIASRPLDDIVEEAERLASGGFREIVLTGIHVASYGQGLRSSMDVSGGSVRERRQDLVDVVEAIAKVPAVERIRMSSIEPRWVTRDRLFRLRATGKVCPHFHLSLQSGSDLILRQMNRKYDTALYAQKVDLIREVFPDAGLTTDVIVGFPGETEKEFEETLEFVQRVGFSRMHIFPYSPREGTPAALFTGQVDPQIKKARAMRLEKEEERLRYAFMDQHIGSVLDVLIEEKRSEEGWPTGYSGNYLRVSIQDEEVSTGEVVGVQIDARKGDLLFGHRFKA